MVNKNVQGLNEETEKKGVVDTEGDAVMVVWKEEINKNQKPPNNNRDSELIVLDVPSKPEVHNVPVSTPSLI